MATDAANLDSGASKSAASTDVSKGRAASGVIDQTPGSLGRVHFDELTRQRFGALIDSAGDSGETVVRDYEDVKRRFEASEGALQEAFWSSQHPAGIALTARRTRQRWRLSVTQTRFHRWTDLLTMRYPNVAAALYRGDNLAHRCEEVLYGSTQRVALGRVFGAMSSLLSLVEVQVAEKAGGAQASRARQEAITDYDKELEKADAYYQEAATRSAHIHYFWGMVCGIAAIAALTTGSVFLVDLLVREYVDSEVSGRSYALAVGTVSAGAIGATVSVMWRMSSGDFKSYYEAGSGHLRMIGGFRPFIGAVFGLALYFALRAGFLDPLNRNQNFYFFAFVAFLGGFSERFAPDVFGRAAKEEKDAERPKS